MAAMLFLQLSIKTSFKNFVKTWHENTNLKNKKSDFLNIFSNPVTVWCSHSQQSGVDKTELEKNPDFLK